jgi:hypothetical protein
VAEKHFMKDEVTAKEKQSGITSKGTGKLGSTGETPKPSGTANLAGVVAAWTAVGVPLAFGLWNTVQQAVALFR